VRLLVVTQYFWPEDFRINELVAELSGRGHDIVVLTGKPNYPGGEVFAEFAANPAVFATYGNVRVIRVPMVPRGSGEARLLLNYVCYALSATVFGAVGLAQEKFDAIFVFEPSPVTVGLPALFLRATRRWPIAFWVLDQWPETLAAVGVVRSERLLNLVGRLVRFIYSHCDVILSPSRLLVPRIRSYCTSGQRVEYFPNWAESAYDTSRSDVAPEVPANPESFTVMFAGNIGEAQDFPAILDAADQLSHCSNIRWILVGDGRMASWVRAEIARRGLGEKVLMLGRYPIERMPSFFLHANALLVSLKSDPVFTMTSPGKIQSYLAFGLPIIAMLDGEGASVVEDARAGLAGRAGDSRQLAENVLKLAALSSDERTLMGRRGMKYAQDEFSQKRLIDQLEGWLAEIALMSRERGTA
jgi:glycosyltransferase involved in cell wall biosynthesis